MADNPKLIDQSCPVRPCVIEKGLDFFGAHYLGMAFFVEDDEALDPIHVGLFGTIGVMSGAESFANTFDKLSASLIK
jgi:hypothetical protein